MSQIYTSCSAICFTLLLSSRCVAGDAADAGPGGAGLAVVDLPIAGHAAGGACAGTAAADTHVHADAGGIQRTFVLQVGGGDGAGAGELVNGCRACGLLLHAVSNGPRAQGRRGARHNGVW